MMGWFARFVVRRRALAWAILIGLSAAAALGLTRLQFDDDLRNAFKTETAETPFQLSENAFIILVRGDNLFAPDAVAALQEFDFALREIPTVESVASIFDVRSSRGEDGYFPPLMPAPESSAEAFAAAASEAAAHPTVNGVFLGRSGKTLLFAVAPVATAHQLRELEPVERAIEQRMQVLRNNSRLQAEVGGFPVLRRTIIGTTRREQVLFAACGAVLCTLTAWVIFRRFAALLILFPVPYLASLWTLGAMGLAGEPINVINTMILVLVMIIAITNATHLIFAIRRHALAGAAPPEAAIAGVEEVGGASFLTSFTTALAFCSLVFSSNEMVVRFGLACAAGVMLVFVAVVLAVALLASSPLGRHLVPRNVSPGGMRWNFFDRVARVALRHSRAFVLAGTVLTVVAIAFCTRFRSDYRYRENLDSTSAEWRLIETIDREFGGSQPLYITVQWPEDRTLDDSSLPSVLQAVHEQLPPSEWNGTPFSLLNVMQAMNLASAPDGLARVIEEAPERSLDSILNVPRRAALVTLPVRDAGSEALFPVIGGIKQRLAKVQEQRPGYRIELTGLTAASIQTSRHMINEFVLSLFAAAIGIFGIIMIAVKSVRLGLASILPNIFPIALVAGALVWFDVPLQYISALSLTIALGVAVDDTIHVLFRFKRERREGVEVAEAIRRSIETVGSALVTSTVILVVGLAILLTSDLPTMRLFGVLTALTLVAALIADLILLPATLAWICGRRSRMPPVANGGERESPQTAGAQL